MSFRAALLLLALVVAAPALAEPAADGQGGLADLSAQDVAALHGVRQRLQEMILDRDQPQHVRRLEIDALARVHEALADWGSEGQADWYFQTMISFDIEQLCGLMAELAEASAKGAVYHVAGVRAFWQRVDRTMGGDLPVYLRVARNRFTNMTRQWERPSSPTAGLQALKTSAWRFDPPRMLAPLRAVPYQFDLPKAIAPQKVAPQRIDLSKTLAPYPEETQKPPQP